MDDKYNKTTDKENDQEKDKVKTNSQSSKPEYGCQSAGKGPGGGAFGPSAAGRRRDSSSKPETPQETLEFLMKFIGL